MDLPTVAFDADSLERAPLDGPVPSRRTRSPAPAPRSRSSFRPPDPMRDTAGEADLIQRARAGDRGAFDDLVRLHFHRVHALLHRMLDSREDAEDLAQETFVRAYRALPEFRGDATLATWLQRIAVHLALAHRRRRGRRTPTGTMGDDVEQPLGVEPADAQARGELVTAVSGALGRLPEKLRAAIVLRALEKREYDELAEILGVRPATARTHVMQARKLLVRWLGPWLDGGRP